MTLHTRAIRYVVAATKGSSHNINSILGVERTFIPDVVDDNGGLHEVEVMNHKFTVDFARKYGDAIKNMVPRNRDHVTLWLVIPNFDGVLHVFDRVEFLVETKKGLKRVELRISEELKKRPMET